MSAIGSYSIFFRTQTLTSCNFAPPWAVNIIVKKSVQEWKFNHRNNTNSNFLNDKRASLVPNFKILHISSQMLLGFYIGNILRQYKVWICALFNLPYPIVPVLNMQKAYVLAQWFDSDFAVSYVITILPIHSCTWINFKVVLSA